MSSLETPQTNLQKTPKHEKSHAGQSKTEENKRDEYGDYCFSRLLFSRVHSPTRNML